MTGLLLSGEPFPNDRPRRNQGITHVRNGRKATQEPSEPDLRDLILALMARIEASEERVEERHAEVLRVLTDIGCDASSASSTAYEVKRELESVLYRPYPG